MGAKRKPAATGTGADGAGSLHLVKLSVGSESVDGLDAWQRSRRHLHPDGHSRHVTRMWPKREAEILGGGSIYWVIRGQILCRQRIARMDEVHGEDGVRRCALVLESELVRTAPTPRRAFQGWRYLPASDAPRDLPGGTRGDGDMPLELSRALSEIGVL